MKKPKEFVEYVDDYVAIYEEVDDILLPIIRKRITDKKKYKELLKGLRKFVKKIEGLEYKFNVQLNKLIVYERQIQAEKLEDKRQKKINKLHKKKATSN